MHVVDNESVQRFALTLQVLLVLAGSGRNLRDVEPALWINPYGQIRERPGSIRQALLLGSCDIPAAKSRILDGVPFLPRDVRHGSVGNGMAVHFERVQQDMVTRLRPVLA